ncbi:hypothetical protein A5699_16280 [Mycobacterium sp. E802]|uniref:hypothetical protein n=1 Tax=Mycobacterium sp. E802 TaxID=1834152 RepID=UPI0008024D88|nr:hypothetical protein [Mycobacterium sp. E802]OBG88658.1 hypothetical protein A5699_16280 [Mycobacterium sp. E802]
MTGFDWKGLEDFLTAQVIDAVAAVAAKRPEDRLYAAAVTDIYTEKMLVLWPSVAVATEETLVSDAARWSPSQWPWQIDATNEGDEWAGRVTAYAGSGGIGFDHVTARFLDAVARSCLRATEEVIAGDFAGPTCDGFVVLADNGDDSVIEQSLTPTQLRRYFPSLLKRRTEIARLRSLPIDDRIKDLLATVCSAPVGGGPYALADELLIEIGPASADALCGHLHRAATQPLTSADSVRCARILQTIAEIGVATPTVTQTLTTVVSDPGVPVVLRSEAAATLAWLGQLTEIVAHLQYLPTQLALDVISRPYIGDRKNGPLDYGPLESVLDAYPEYDDALFARLSPNVMFEINAADLQPATAALSSRWRVVRRHAAIVILSTHL